MMWRYTNLETEKKYELLTGLFFSTYTPRHQPLEKEKKSKEKEVNEEEEEDEDFDFDSDGSEEGGVHPKREEYETTGISEDDLYPFLNPQFAYVTRHVEAVSPANYKMYVILFSLRCHINHCCYPTRKL